MARQQQDSLAAHGVNREDRAERARRIVSRTIPEHLRSSPRARHGIHKSVVIADPLIEREDDINTAEQARPWRPRIRIRNTDTLSAARQLTYSSRRASLSAGREQATRRIPNVCVLNQASAIRPGGGFLDGVHSQEEFLCQRSTLFASLWDKLYPLPEYGGVFSSDILVFGDSTLEAEELPKRDRVFVDVISANMIRFPGAPRWKHDGEAVRAGCSCGVSYCDLDRSVVTSKMNAVLKIAQSQGAEKLVLGAWGCGSYLNPPREVARLWKKVLFGTTRSPVTWPGLKEIVFAITEKQALREFEKCFADVVASSFADAERSPPPERALPNDEKPRDEVHDIITKIQETEVQLAQTQTARTRGRLRDLLVSLNKQLTELSNSESPEDEPNCVDNKKLDEDVEEDFVVGGYPRSDNEDNSYYNFDEDDIASSDSATPASTYEFRFDSQAVDGAASTSSVLDDGYVHAIPPSIDASPVRAPKKASSFERDAEDRRKLDETGGWFSGSVNELSALLRKTGGAIGQNPALSPVDTRQDQAAFPEY